MNTPFDPGLQAERTKLAWQRTSLSLGLGCLVYGRVAATTVGTWAWILAGCGLLVATMISIRARHRYDYTHRSLQAGIVKLPDGLLPVLLATAVTLGGLIILVLSILHILAD